MPKEKSAGAVIFRREKDKIKYLLLQLHYLRDPKNFKSAGPYWDLPKGHIEEGETEGRAMRREVFEETGIKDLSLVPKFREVIKYFFKWEGKTIFKMVVFYFGETKTSEIKISSEHMGYKWSEYKDALEELTFDGAKNILKKANERLENYILGIQ